MQDSELLRRYAMDRNEAAFGDLVRAYVDLVHSVAARQLGHDAYLAEEVTQSVFLLLAKRARSLQEHPTLAGWLYRVTQHLAAKTQRSETRRKLREMKAVDMNNPSQSDDNFEEILPLLDQAVGALNEGDRLAILLRFFLKKPMREVGLALGVTEPAAKMRVARAVERLRQFFLKEGIRCSVGVLTFVLAEKSVTAAPATLSPSIVTNRALGPTFSTAPNIINLMMLMTKTKLRIGLLGALILIGLLSFDSYWTWVKKAADSSPSVDTKTLASEKKRSFKRSQSGSAVSLWDASASDTRVRRLRSALSAHLKKNGLSWPDVEVIEAVAAFESPEAAFALLRAAVTDPQHLVTGELGIEPPEDLVRERALMGIVPLASRVPDVVPFLWDTFRTDNFRSKGDAFSALKQIGFKAENTLELVQSLPEFINSPAMQMFVPKAIAELIVQNPAANESSVSFLEGLLTDPDENLRLSAASALIGQSFADSMVSEVLSNGLASNNKVLNRVAVEALTRAGGQSSSFAAQLLDLSKGAQEDYYKKELLRAAAHLQPDLSEKSPEVAEMTNLDNEAKTIGLKLSGGKAPIEDLLAALRFPQHAFTAAMQLGEMGAAATAAIPGLLEALENRSEDERDRVVEVIHKIDPNMEVSRVDKKTISAALLETRVTLGEREDGVYNFVMQHAAQPTWWTLNETISFAKELGSRDRRLQEVFINKVIQGNPALHEQLEGLVK